MTRAWRRAAPELVFAAIIVFCFAMLLAAPHALLPPIPCLFHSLTGYPCVGCGGTRALLLLAQGDLFGASLMNPLVAAGALVSAIFVGYVLALVIFERDPVRVDFRRGAPLLLLRFAAPALVAANWIYLISDGR